MPWGAVIGAVGTIAGGLISADGASDAAETQAGASRAGIAETRRQFNVMQNLLRPYVGSGRRALGDYQALAGMINPRVQQAAIDDLQKGAEYRSLTKQGEKAILANASATGGLRGGDVQGSLADYRSNLLSSLIERQLNRTGGLAQMGQNSAARVGSAALTTGQQVSGLMQQGGAAIAGGQLAGANAIGSAVGSLGGIVGGMVGGGGGGGGGGGVTPANPYYGDNSGFGTGLAYGNQDMGAYF